MYWMVQFRINSSLSLYTQWIAGKWLCCWSHSLVQPFLCKNIYTAIAFEAAVCYIIICANTLNKLKTEQEIHCNGKQNKKCMAEKCSEWEK